MSEDRLEITVHFKDGEFPRELVINRAGREVDHVDMDGRRLEDVVRCRDCKDYRASDATCHSWQWHNWDAAIEVEPDGFCAWAERKEGGDE